MKLILMGMIFVLFSGCATTWKPAYSVDTIESSGDIVDAKATDNMAYIYLYRESGFIGAGAAWEVTLNNKGIGSLKNGAYLLIKTTPGQKVLSPKSALAVDEEYTLNAKAGQSYFLKHAPPSLLSFSMGFSLQDNATTRDEIRSYDLVKIYEDYDPSYMREVYKQREKCPQSSTKEECIVVVADIRGKVIINRGTRGFKAEPGMKLRVGDKVITTGESEAFIIFYGEPKMIRVNTTYKVLESNNR